VEKFELCSIPPPSRKMFEFEKFVVESTFPEIFLSSWGILNFAKLGFRRVGNKTWIPQDPNELGLVFIGK